MTLPTNQFVPYQSSLTLYVSADATGQTNRFPISYQWQVNGTDIPAATSSNHTFTVLSSWSYSVIVSSAAGTTNLFWLVRVLFPGNVVTV